MQDICKLHTLRLHSIINPVCSRVLQVPQKMNHLLIWFIFSHELPESEHSQTFCQPGQLTRNPNGTG